MSAPDRWRQQAAYCYSDRFDLADMAWEYLRRNPDYRADVATAEHSGAHWGVHFRAAARCSGWRCPGVLAAGAAG